MRTEKDKKKKIGKTKKTKKKKKKKKTGNEHRVIAVESLSSWKNNVGAA